MKRVAAAILTVCLLALAGCGRIVEPVSTPSHVYASFYPIYALSGLVLDGISGIRLSCLTQPQDGCLRSYGISDWDLYRLSYDADAVIIGGRGLESFESLLYSIGDTGPAVISAMTGLELYNDEDDTEITEDTSHLVGANPYLYMSINGAEAMTSQISDALKALYPSFADEIDDNTIKALETLSDIRTRCGEIAGDISGNSIILMNEALIYAALDYGLDVEYWYDRESGTGISGNDLIEVIKDLNECTSKIVLIEKQAPTSLTEALSDAGFTVCLLDTMTTCVSGEGGNGYERAQLMNAQALKNAINGGDN